jgi:hypothetical protein
MCLYGENVLKSSQVTTWLEWGHYIKGKPLFMFLGRKILSKRNCDKNVKKFTMFTWKLSDITQNPVCSNYGTQGVAWGIILGKPFL